jgi:two-component system sensor histidine kinase BaeS
MGLRVRLALTFAAVAIATAAAVAVATPIIVGHGFARVLVLGDEVGGGAGDGTGPGRGRFAGPRAGQIQDETEVALVLVAVAAAGVASLLGILVAGRIARPLEDLEQVAASVAAGDLGGRSGLAGRRDELGSLGRSFDAMAASLARDEEARRRLIQDVSHELRTPLTVIDATVDAMLDGVWPREDRHLETVRAQSRILARVVDDLRMVALAESGHLPMLTGPVAVGPVLTQVAEGFAARAAAAGVTVMAVARVDLVARADRDRLTQLLGALVDNALRHTPSGGAVTLDAAATAAGVAITVRDTGPGIPSEDLQHVFERFYRAEVARDRASGGSGLGLAIVAALTGAMGGTVSAANAPTGGAVFCVELPAGALRPPSG